MCATTTAIASTGTGTATGTACKMTAVASSTTRVHRHGALRIEQWFTAVAGASSQAPREALGVSLVESEMLRRRRAYWRDAIRHARGREVATLAQRRDLGVA